MRLNKSQAALEFIMTYGWAVLVAMIAVGTLAYFGVLSPDNFIPQQCTLPAGIACLDFRMESQKATLVLKNNMGGDITLSEITVNDDHIKCINSDTVVLSNDEKITVEVLCDGSAASRRFMGYVNTTYAIEGGLTHKRTGILNARIDDISLVSNQTVIPNETIVLVNSSLAAIRISPYPNLYNVSLEDLDGISYFIIFDSSGYAMSGGSASCLQEAVLGPFSIMPSKFPIKAYYNDCENPGIDYELNASMPP